MIKFWNQMCKLLRKNLRVLLVFEVFYTSASFLFSVFCVRFFIDGALYAVGYSNLTPENFPFFLKHPFTWGCALLLLLILLSLLLVEVSALFVCCYYSAGDVKIYVSDMFFLGIRQAVSFVRGRPISGWIYMLATVPFLKLLVLIWGASYVKILQYAMRLFVKFVPAKWFLLLLIGCLWFFSCIVAFAFPYLIIEKNTIRQSLKKVWEHRKKRMLFSVCMVQAGVVLFSIVSYMPILAGVVWYVQKTREVSMIIPALIQYNDWMELGIGLFAGALGMVLGVAQIYQIYAQVQQTNSVLSKKAYFPVLKRTGFRRKRAVFMAIVMLGEFIYICFYAGVGITISDDIWSGTQITAHRGGAKCAPENTLAALRTAKEQMADCAEIDVQETKDGVVVLLHDSNLKRTTGINRNIWDVSYAQIKNLDAGSHFNRDFAGERIPTLESALNLCKNNLRLNIEIKYNGHNPDIVEKVVQILERCRVKDQVIIASMNYRFLQQVKALDPDIKTSYVLSMIYGSAVNLSDADYVSVKYSYLSKKYVEDAHRMGKEVHAWTVNDRWLMNRMKYYGVDHIITDSPGLGREIVTGTTREKAGYWELVKYVL